MKMCTVVVRQKGSKGNKFRFTNNKVGKGGYMIRKKRDNSPAFYYLIPVINIQYLWKRVIIFRFSVEEWLRLKLILHNIFLSNYYYNS